MKHAFVLLIRLLVTNRLLVVKFSGNQKLYMDFQLYGGGSVPQTPMLPKGQLYCNSYVVFSFFSLSARFSLYLWFSVV